MIKNYEVGQEFVLKGADGEGVDEYDVFLSKREAEIANIVQAETIKALGMNCTPEELAKRFHDHYEHMAGEHNYETRESSRVDWDDVPENNKNLMIAVCSKIINGE